MSLFNSKGYYDASGINDDVRKNHIIVYSTSALSSHLTDKVRQFKNAMGIVIINNRHYTYNNIDRTIDEFIEHISSDKDNIYIIDDDFAKELKNYNQFLIKKSFKDALNKHGNKNVYMPLEWCDDKLEHSIYKVTCNINGDNKVHIVVADCQKNVDTMLKRYYNKFVDVVSSVAIGKADCQKLEVIV